MFDSHTCLRVAFMHCDEKILSARKNIHRLNQKGNFSGDQKEACPKPCPFTGSRDISRLSRSGDQSFSVLSSLKKRPYLRNCPNTDKLTNLDPS